VVEANAFLTEISETLEDHSIPADEPIEKYEDQQSEEETEYWLNIFGEEPEDEDA
jgi:hypothetical protein